MQQQYFMKKQINGKFQMRKNSKTEKWKIRRRKNIKTYIFRQKPYVKNDNFEKKLF